MLIQNLMLAGSSLLSKGQRLSPLQSRMVRGSTLCKTLRVNTAHRQLVSLHLDVCLKVKDNKMCETDYYKWPQT